MDEQATVLAPGSGFPLDAEDVPDLLRRLNRATGQLHAVGRMLGEGRDCTDVIPQFVAARRALDKIGFKVMESALRTCLTNTEADPQDRARLERLFLTLS